MSKELASIFQSQLTTSSKIKSEECLSPAKDESVSNGDSVLSKYGLRLASQETRERFGMMVYEVSAVKPFYSNPLKPALL